MKSAKWISSILFGLSVVLLILRCSEGDTTQYGISIEPKYVAIADDNTAYFSWPSIVKAQNGNLIVAYYSGANHNRTKGDYIARISADLGATWSAPVTVHSDAHYNVGMLSLTTLNNGDILAGSYTIQVEGDAAPYQVVSMYVVRSTDSGESWNAPSLVTVNGYYNLSPSGDFYQLDNGSILWPVFGWTGDGQTGTATSMILQSDDNGATWTFLSVVGSGSEMYAETVIVPLDNGTLRMFLRGEVATMQTFPPDPSGRRCYRSDSGDSGATWSAPVVAHYAAGKPSHIKLTSGKILAAIRSDGSAAHTRMPVLIESLDDGVTWGTEMEIDRTIKNGTNDNPYAQDEYSDLIEVSPGVVALVYSIDQDNAHDGSDSPSCVRFKYLYDNFGVLRFGGTVQ